MNFCVTAVYTKAIKELGVITLEYNKRKYCEKHGYDLDLRTDPSKFNTQKDFGIAHFGYEKIGILLELLEKKVSEGTYLEDKKYDWVFWCGSDTMITNYDIKLEDLIDTDYHFIVPNDLWGINADCILARNSPECIEFLQEVYSTFFKYVNEDGTNIDTGERLPDGGARSWAEQGAILDLKDKYKDVVKVVPQKTMNSYLYNFYPSPWHKLGLDCDGNDGTWSKGDFMLHLPGMPNDVRLNVVLNILKDVIGDDTATAEGGH